MNWPRTILDGISMALLFNAVVGVGFLLYPLYLLLFIYWAVSAHFAEIQGFWTFLVCPIAGLIVAGIGTLLG